MKEQILRAINHDLPHWKKGVKNEVIDQLKDYLQNYYRLEFGVMTPLFPFEIYLLNDGFNMIYYSPLNAFCRLRVYKKDNNAVVTRYMRDEGITPHNFCFSDSRVYTDSGCGYGLFDLLNQKEEYDFYKNDFIGWFNKQENPKLYPTKNPNNIIRIQDKLDETGESIRKDVSLSFYVSKFMTKSIKNEKPI